MSKQDKRGSSRTMKTPITISGHGEDESGTMRIDFELYNPDADCMSYTTEAAKALANAILNEVRKAETCEADSDDLTASRAREQALREEVETLRADLHEASCALQKKRTQRDEARQEAEDAVAFLDQHIEHHPWSTVPLLWLRGEQDGEK